MARMISATRAAEMLGVSRARVNQLVHEGKLRAEKVGSYWAVDEGDVLARMRSSNGEVEFGGRSYVLLAEAVPGGDGYTADAVCAEDEPDEDGLAPVYRVEWDATEDGEPDWSEPSSVEPRDLIDLHVPDEEEQKWEEARRLAGCGRYPWTYAANVARVAALPDSLTGKLDAADIAALVDAFRACYHAGDAAGRARNE